MTKIKIYNVEQLKVGDTIIIEKQPHSWSSTLNKTFPFGKVTFPHKLTIKEIKYGGDFTAMTCGDFGWTLDSIVNAGCYKVNRFPFTLKRDEAKEILSVADDYLNTYLVSKWGADLIVNDYTIIDEAFYKKLRESATEELHKLYDNIFGKDKEEYKAGNYVLVDKYFEKYNNKVLKISEIKYKEFCYFEEPPQDNDYKEGSNFNIRQIVRKATEQEIKEYEQRKRFPYKKGDLIFVRTTLYNSWSLRYFSHVEDDKVFVFTNQKQQGETVSLEHHSPAPNVKLPK